MPAFTNDPEVNFQDVAPQVVVAQPTSWNGLAGQMRQVVGSALRGGDGLRRKLTELLAGTETAEEKLARIHRFVSQEIRYLGLEQGVGGIIPRPTDLTLARGFGDCKDKTALFVEMARRAGFEAYAVLTSISRYEPAKLITPAASYFDHMVACVRISPDKELCSDLTDPYSDYDVSLDVLGAAVRLDLHAGSRPPSAFAVGLHKREKAVRTEITFGSDGSVRQVETTRYSGALGALARGYLLRLSAQERNRWAREEYDRYYKPRREESYEFDGLDDVSQPVAVRFKAHFNEKLDLTSLETFTDSESWLSHETSSYQTGNTAHDFRFDGLRYHGETIYRLPAGHSPLHTGPRVSFESPYGTLSREYHVSARSIRVLTELNMPRAIIPVEKIAEYNRFLDQILDHSRIWFTTERSSS